MAQTFGRQLAAAPCTAPAHNFQFAHGGMHSNSFLQRNQRPKAKLGLGAAPCSGTSTQRTLSRTPYTCGGALLWQQHKLQSAPCSGTSTQAPKRTQASLPILEVRTPIVGTSKMQVSRKNYTGIDPRWRVFRFKVRATDGCHRSTRQNADPEPAPAPAPASARQQQLRNPNADPQPAPAPSISTAAAPPKPKRRSRATPLRS